MNTNFFVIGASLVSVIASLPYIWSILKGQTRPSGASWWTWFFITVITVISSYFAGAPWQVLVLPVWLCFSQLIIAILSIKRGNNNWDRLNKFCVAGALIGVGMWIVTGQPLTALIISIIADIFASIPNFRHIWWNPEQENKTGWFLGWLSAVLQIFTITIWSVAESGWAIYFLCNMSLTLLLVFRPLLVKSITK